MVKILGIHARQILDSRGNPAVECDLRTTDGTFRASVPSGASTGIHEAIELRDGGKAFHGRGVTNAVKNINTTIAKKLKYKVFTSQEECDRMLIALDGTHDKSNLGANATLAVSQAYARAAAVAYDRELFEQLGHSYGTSTFTLPVPAFNIVNGGKHAGNQLDIQEYMILPVGAKNFAEAVLIGSEIYHELKKNLEHAFGKNAINVGDEGGFAPPFKRADEPFEHIMEAAITTGHAKKIKLGIDAAASTFAKEGTYLFEGKQLTTRQLLARYEELANTFPLASIEDPFDEDDFTAFASLREALPRAQIVGDDLLCTNPERVKQAIAHNSCNALLLKINQIGTITEALDAAKLARNDGWNIMVSHRSGETCDSFIADLAVGIHSELIKSGAPCRGERLAKYNQLMRIEEQLGRRATYAGKTIRFA